VDGRRSPRGRAGGGVGIQALRQARTRLILGTLAALVYGGLVAYVCTRKPQIVGLLATLGGLGGLLLLLVLVQRWDELLPWSLLLVAGAYAVAIAARGGEVDEAAPLVGAGLLLCAELATWSLDERLRIGAERSVVLSRAGALAALVLASAAAAALVIGLAAAPVGGGLGWTVLGAAAAVAVVALAVRLARG
jgi:hypothetical protein